MPNPDLKWETTYTHNLALDFSFWNSRLSGTVEVYQSDVKDLLIHFPVAGGKGYPVHDGGKWKRCCPCTPAVVAKRTAHNMRIVFFISIEFAS